MRMSHISGMAVATLMLTAVGVSVPAPAHAAAPAAVSASVSARKPSSAATGQKPTKVHKAHKLHTSHKASPGAAKHAAVPVVVPPKRHPSKVGAKAPARVAVSVPRTASAVLVHTAVASPPVRRASAPPAKAAVPRRAPDVMQQVVGAVQDVYSLFGWNLIALIPLTGIAFAISRQMRPGRGSAQRRGTVRG